MKEFVIIKATSEDYLALIQVWEASVRATHHFLNESDILSYKKLILNKYFDQVDLYCIKEYHAFQGFIGLSGDTIQMLFIHPDQRGKGIGKHLIAFAIAENNVNKVDVNEQNKQAVGFYKHLGFVITERYENDAAGKPYPVIAMELR